MHNYYMFHGGNHLLNWSQGAPTTLGSLGAGPGLGAPPLGGPLSSTNTVRYANAAPMHSDGTRNLKT